MLNYTKMYHMWIIVLCVTTLMSVNECKLEKKILKVEYKKSFTETRSMFSKQTSQKVHIDISCQYPIEWSLPFPIQAQDIYNSNTKVHIGIFSCTMPNMSLVQTFEKLKVDASLVEGIKFKDCDFSLIPSNYTVGALLSYIELSNAKNINVSENIFKDLHELSEVKVEHMKMPQLPPSSELQLKILTLNNTSIKKWDNCVFLRELKIIGVTKAQVPSKWPSDCKKMVKFTLDSLDQESIEYMVDGFEESSLINIENLAITSSFLSELPLRLIVSPKHLKTLDLSHIKLENIGSQNRSQFPVFDDLKILKIANSNMTEDFLTFFLSLTPSLEELDLKDNNVQANRSKHKIALIISNLGSLERLYIDEQLVNINSFMRHRFPKLKYFNWKKTQFVKLLGLDTLPRTNNNELTVDLRETTVKYLGVGGSKKYIFDIAVGPDFVEDFEDADSSYLWITSKGYKLTVLLDAVDCDCNNDVLAHALRLFKPYLEMPGLKCSNNGGLFAKEPYRNLACRKATVNGCVRRMSRQTNYTTDVDCSYNEEVFRWPQPKGFYGLNASGNNIQSITNAYLPGSLEWLDLRNNKITHVKKEETSKLFTKRRKLWLSNNSIVCDCDNQHFIEAIQRNQSLVQDYDTLICAEGGQLIKLVDAFNLCKVKLDFLWATINVIVVLLAITILLMRYYWIEIKVYMYARGYCLCCISEEDLDADRPYDAFISFAHGDEEFVMNELVSRMESEPLSYRLCVHYRDWLIGEWIPAQIMQSVRSSKRTVIVLSRHFVRSWWGVLEFRYACANATVEGRSRLLVLVKDDVLDEDLSTELLGYVKQNTYLRCDDPWFWDKLHYAMPHVKFSKRNSNFRTPLISEPSQSHQNDHLGSTEMIDVINCNHG